MNGGSMAVIWKWKPSHHRGPSHSNGSWLVLRSEGDMAKSKQDHDRVNCVFWLGMCCPSQVCPSKPNNKEYYLNVLCWLRGNNKKPQLWATGDRQVHHDNVPSHASHLMQSFLAKHQITRWLSPSTAQIWCPATSVFSQREGSPVQFPFGAHACLSQREVILDHWWDSGKYNGAVDGDFNKGFCSFLNSGRDTGRNVEVPGCLL